LRVAHSLSVVVIAKMHGTSCAGIAYAGRRRRNRKFLAGRSNGATRQLFPLHVLRTQKLGDIDMRFIAALVLWLVILVGAGAAFVWSGIYNIGADSPHWPVTAQILAALRNHSIAQHDANINVPDLDNPQLIALGAKHYAEMCTGCHLAPGKTDSEMRTGLYPKPPNFTRTHIGNPAMAFWVIKHGIKMSAMPAWGKTHDDHKIWAMVAFVRQLPNMSIARYKQLSAGNAHDGDDDDHDAATPDSGPAAASQTEHDDDGPGDPVR